MGTHEHDERKVKLESATNDLVEPYQTAPEDLTKDFDEAVDVVIIGSGFAGLAAAISRPD